MLRYMLDTNLCIRVLRDRPASLRDRFNSAAENLCISTIVLTELLQGAAKPARPEHNRREVDRFAARLEILPFDTDAAGHAADIRATLERQGQPIGGYDLLIAGHARSRGLLLLTGTPANSAAQTGSAARIGPPDMGLQPTLLRKYHRPG